MNAQEGDTKKLALTRYQLAVRYYYIMLEALLKKVSDWLELIYKRLNFKCIMSFKAFKMCSNF